MSGGVEWKRSHLWAVHQFKFTDGIPAAVSYQFLRSRQSARVMNRALLDGRIGLLSPNENYFRFVRHSPATILEFDGISAAIILSGWMPLVIDQRFRCNNLAYRRRGHS